MSSACPRNGPAATTSPSIGGAGGDMTYANDLRPFEMANWRKLRLFQEYTPLQPGESIWDPSLSSRRVHNILGGWTMTHYKPQKRHRKRPEKALELRKEYKPLQPGENIWDPSLSRQRVYNIIGGFA